MTLRALLTGSLAAALCAATVSAQKIYTPKKTAWGDPDLQGVYTNKDENGIPFERPSPADSPDDRSLYDRCITRGIPGSMMPAIYGNSYEIIQSPGWVAIRYEMIHETRLIPLDSRPHLPSRIQSYMGDARGHFEGNTLV